MHKVWVYGLVVLIGWQALVLLAVYSLPAEITLWVALACAVVFGTALLMLFHSAQKRATRSADHKVLNALNELDSVRRKANKDEMTGLNSRVYMYERLSECINVAVERGHSCAVLLMDLDFFKDINDALGHQMGNQVLVAAADRLQSLVKKGDLLGYVGGDEFMIILPQIQDNMAAELVARRILTALTEPFSLEGRTLVMSASLGVSIGPQDGDDVETLIREAESALAQAKSRGRKGYQFFTQSMNQQASERLQIDQQLRGALERGEMNLVYQPIIHSKSRQLKGMEALIRWTNPELGRVQPTQFIPVAEQIGFISELGNWVLREACAQLMSWQQKYERQLVMSINVSPRQFHEGSIVPAVKSTLSRLGLKAGSLQVEVTENLLINASERLIADLYTLKTTGVRLALDDFGTGYSSLSYLQQLPFDVLKIDKSFVNLIAIRAQEEAMVGAIVNMGHSLGMVVVAEGVETAEQSFSLDQLGVDDLQGYYFSQPLSAREFEHRFLEGGLQAGTALDDSIWDRL